MNTPAPEDDTSVAAHGIRDARLLAELAASGADLDAPHVITCRFRVPAYESAQFLAVRLADKGLTALSVTSDASGEWQVVGRLTESPVLLADRQITEQFVELASTCGGWYEGWSTVAGSA